MKQLTLADVVLTMADLYKAIQTKSGDYRILDFPNTELRDKFNALEEDIKKYPSTKTRKKAETIIVNKETRELYRELTHDKTAKEYLEQAPILNMGWRVI